MIRICCMLGLTFLIQQKSYVEMSTTEFFTGKYADETLNLDNTNYELLDATIFHTINKHRINKQLTPYHYNASLYQVARQIQDELEFRPFSNGKKISSKVNNHLTTKTTNAGYKGQLTKIIASQNDGINYDGTTLYHYDREKQSTSGFHIYYGKKSSKVATEVQSFTYAEIAENILSSLPKEELKIINSNTYQDCGIHLLWYYKTLNRRKIPQMKTLVVLGGFATKKIR